MREFGRTLLIFAIISCLASICQSESCAMLETARDAFSVKFETDRRGRLKSLDTIEVSFYYSDRVDKSCADDLVLHMEMPDGSWEEVSARKQDKRDKKRGRKRYFLWKVEDILPCRINRFRLVSGENYIESELEPAELEDLEEFEFAPGSPKNIVYASDELKWDPIECATEYKVEVVKLDNQDEEIFNENIGDTSVFLSGLKYCHEYEYVIYPMIGDFESTDDEEFGEFTKEPSYDVLSALDISVEASEDDALISWEITDEILCVDKYIVEVCEVNNIEECKKEIVYDPVEENTFSVKVDELKQATAYQVSLAAVYRGQDDWYKDFKTEFNTMLDVGGFKVEAIADFENVTITWSDVSIAQRYILYRQLSGRDDWEVLADDVDDVMYQLHEEPCIDITYAVAVVTSEMEYDKKESNSVNLQLDESQPFFPKEQSVVMFVDAATLSWTHLECIDAYEVSISDEQMLTKSTNHTLASDIVGEEGLFYEIEGLTPCTFYTVEVVPMIGGERWSGAPLTLEMATDQLLEPPSQDSVEVGEWTPDTPVRISWDNTSCALEYEVYFEDTKDQNSYFYKITEEESVEFDSLERNSCTEYMFQIAAIAGNNRSEDTSIGHFFVGPSVSSLEEFSPDISVGISSVDMTIPNTDALKCIDSYEITICTSEGYCPVDDIIEPNADDEDTFPFRADNLTSATDYSVSLFLIYGEETLHTYSTEFSTPLDLYGVEFRASSQDVADVYLEWDEVFGADEYEIGQEIAGSAADQAKSEHQTVTTTYAYMEQPACTTATYSLTPRRRGQGSDTKYTEEVTTYLNTTEPYVVENLDIELGESSTTLTWDHLGSCVDYYRVVLNDETVLEHRVPLGSSEVVVTLDSLETCVSYTLNLVPVFTNSEEWEGEGGREVKRLDDKSCEVPKVTRREEPSLKSQSPLPRVSSSPTSGPIALLSITLTMLVMRW